MYHAQIGEGMFGSCENPQCTIVFSNLLNELAFSAIAADKDLKNSSSSSPWFTNAHRMFARSWELNPAICFRIANVLKASMNSGYGVWHLLSAQTIDLGDLCAESGQTLQGSFSAVSKPNFATKYSSKSSRRDLHNALLCTVFGIQIRKAGKKEPGQNRNRKGENEKRISRSSIPSTSAKGSRGEKIARLKIEYAYDNWSPFF